MLENPARVVRVEGEFAWVCADSPSSCAACGGKGCGSSLWARMLHPREPEYPVLNPIGAQAGDRVVVGLPEGALFSAVLTGYLVPLLLLLSGALIGGIWGEWPSVAGAAAGLTGALVWLRHRRAPPSPSILRLGGGACSTRSSPA